MLDRKVVAERIAEARQYRGMTLTEVAEKVGIDKSTIMRYEKCQVKKMKPPVIEAIARAFDVNPAWIVGKADRQLVSESADKPLDGDLTKRQTEILSATSDLTDEELGVLLSVSRWLRSLRKAPGGQE